MIEIIALILLTGQIGRLATRKGLKAGWWQFYTVLAWLAGEFVGAVIGVMIFGVNNFISVILVALAGAITGFLILKAKLTKIPDPDDDINQIGMP